MLGARSQFIGKLLLLGAKFFQAHELGDVFHAMNDVGQFSFAAKHGRIDGAPLAFLEIPAFGIGTADVIFLRGHGIGDAAFQDKVQGSAEIFDTVGMRIIGIVRKNFKNSTAQDSVPSRHGGFQVGIAGSRDCEFRGQN